MIGEDYEPNLALEEAMEKIGCGGDSSQDEGEGSNFNSGRESPTTGVAHQPATTTTETYTPYTSRYPNAAEDEGLLRSILSDPERCRHFRRFVERRRCEANLMFWASCERYRKTSPIESDRLKDIVYAITARFLSKGAHYRVSISKRVADEIRAAIRYGSPPSVHLFVKAQEEVFQQMLQKEFRDYMSSSDSMSDVDSNVSIGTLSSYGNYPPYPSKPSSTICDSSSTLIFGSDPGVPKRSQRKIVLRKPVSSTRSTVSDTAALPMNKVRLPKKVTSQEEFVALITERLLAVQKDRDQMKKEVLEMPLVETSSEEQALDWYDHPGARIYDRSESTSVRTGYQSGTTAPNDTHNHHRHSQAPLRTPLKPHHLDDYAQHELDSALKDMHIRATHKQHTYNMRPMSDVTDSGISSDGKERQTGNSGISRVLNYVQGQQNFQDHVSKRDLEAQQVATILISNTPAVDHPAQPYVFPDWDFMSKGQPSGPYQYSPPGQSPYPKSSDDSTTISSHLFVPRQTRDVYSEPEQRHHLNRHARSTRTNPGQKKSKPTAPQSGRELLILYWLDNEPIPYQHKVEDREITLGEFKETVFKRQGEHRFFFNEWNDEINTEVRNEYDCDDFLLPRCNGRISGKIEKITC